MEMIFVLLRELKALVKITPEKDHAILNGVHLEISGDKVILVATDGVRLIVQKSRAGNNVICPTGAKIRFTIPKTGIDRLPNINWLAEDEAGSNADRVVGILFDPQSDVIGMGFRGDVIECKNTGSNYPNWRAFLPYKEDGESFTINSNLFSGIADALSEIEYSTSAHLTIRYQSDQDPILVSNPDHKNDFVAVVIPIRNGGKSKLPDWIH